MHREILAAIEAERVAIKDLNRPVKDAAPADQAALQTEIENAKKAAQVSALQIQLCYAVAEGRAAAQFQIEKAIETLKNPPNVQEVMNSMTK